MKKNITINLCGRLYQIDEDAFALLSKYTDSLRSYFSKQDGGSEIADDIEQRIAELFDELKANGTEAITIEHVEGIIHQIGNVEDITGEAEEETSESSTKANANANAQKPKTQTKSFFRDGNDKVLCGVLSGCAHYFGGTASAWRWIYTAVCAAWLVILGFNPFSLAFVAGGLAGLVGFLMLILFAPLVLAPAIPYFLVAIFAKEASNPEDSLKMKGKEVNPQNIAQEVTEQANKKEKDPNSVSIWNAIAGVFSIGLSITMGIMFLIPLCMLVILIVNPSGFISNMCNVNIYPGGLILPFILLFLSILGCIGVLLYCSIHSAVSSFKKCKPMSVTQRIVWLAVWIVSVLAIVGSAVLLSKQREEIEAREFRIRHEEQAEWDRQHTHDGIVMNDEDWDVIREGGWTISKSQNTDRYTYAGDYIDGDETVRYLDCCNWYNPVIVTIEKTDSIQPGIYTLAAACRADEEGKYIFAQVEGNDTVYVSEMPATGDRGGNIWAAASTMSNDLVRSSRVNDIVKHTDKVNVNVDDEANDETVDEDIEVVNEEEDVYSLGADSTLVRQYMNTLYGFTPKKYAKIKNSKDGEGNGWNAVFVKNIVITKPTTITYGVSTDPDLTGGEACTGYFSASDFRLIKQQ